MSMATSKGSSIFRCERPQFDTLGLRIHGGDNVRENIWLLFDMPDAACNRHFGFERFERVPARQASMSLDGQRQKITRHIVSFTIGPAPVAYRLSDAGSWT
jgi:hypothetical protein